MILLLSSPHLVIPARTRFHAVYGSAERGNSEKYWLHCNTNMAGQPFRWADLVTIKEAKYDGLAACNRGCAQLPFMRAATA